MSLSTADKNYWTKELKNALNNKILSILRETGNVNLLEEAKEKLGNKLLVQFDLLESYNNLKAKKEQSSKLYEQYRDLEAEINVEKAKIGKVLATRTQSHFNPYENNVLENLLNVAVVGQLPQELRENYGNVGADLAALLDSSQNLERTIMVATSGNQLKTFVTKFCAKFGLSIDSDLM